MKTGCFSIGIRNTFFYTEGNEKLEYVAQRGGRCPSLEIFKVSAQCSGQPDVDEDDPAHCRGFGP